MFLLKLILKNAFRHTLRSSLTVLGVAVAILAFGMLRTLIDTWYLGVEASSASRLVTRNAISLIFPLPLAYREKIRSVDGVAVVSPGNWFGGIYIDEKNFFASFALEPDSFFSLYPEILLSEPEAKAFGRDRKGAVVGRKLAERFNWKIGDTITLKGTIYPGDWPMNIVGIYRGARTDTDETVLYFQWDYLNEATKKRFPDRADQVGFYMIGIDDASRAAEISHAVDALFLNSRAETLTETEKAFQLGFVAMSSAILVAIEIVSYVVILIILAVAANTMAMSARERTGEYAVFKTLGFHSSTLAWLLVGESLTLSLSGALLGLALLFPTTQAFGKALSQFLPSFQVAPSTLAMGAAAGLFVGLAAAAVPALTVARVRIAEGLRRIG